MIGMLHYGSTLGLFEQDADEQARALEAYEHVDYLQAQAAKKRQGKR